MENTALFILWLLIGVLFVFAIVFFIVAEIKEQKPKKKQKNNKENLNRKEAKMVKCSICGKEVPQEQARMNMESYQFECLNCIEKNSTKV